MFLLIIRADQTDALALLDHETNILQENSARSRLLQADTVEFHLPRQRRQKLRAHDLTHFAWPIQKSKENKRTFAAAANKLAMRKEADQRPIKANEGGCQRDCAGHS